MLALGRGSRITLIFDESKLFLHNIIVSSEHTLLYSGRVRNMVELLPKGVRKDLKWLRKVFLHKIMKIKVPCLCTFIWIFTQVPCTAAAASSSPRERGVHKIWHKHKETTTIVLAIVSNQSHRITVTDYRYRGWGECLWQFALLLLLLLLIDWSSHRVQVQHLARRWPQKGHGVVVAVACRRPYHYHRSVAVVAVGHLHLGLGGGDGGGLSSSSLWGGCDSSHRYLLTVTATVAYRYSYYSFWFS